MNFTNEDQAREAIEQWREQSQGAQLSKLKKAIEGLELNRMYYEDKGSERSAERIGRILDILEERREVLAAAGEEGI